MFTVREDRNRAFGIEQSVHRGWTGLVMPTHGIITDVVDFISARIRRCATPCPATVRFRGGSFHEDIQGLLIRQGQKKRVLTTCYTRRFRAIIVVFYTRRERTIVCQSQIEKKKEKSKENKPNGICSWTELSGESIRNCAKGT